MESHSSTAAFIWSVADLLREGFKQSQYGRKSVREPDPRLLTQADVPNQKADVRCPGSPGRPCSQISVPRLSRKSEGNSLRPAC